MITALCFPRPPVDLERACDVYIIKFATPPKAPHEERLSFASVVSCNGIFTALHFTSKSSNRVVIVLDTMTPNLRDMKVRGV